MITLLIAAAAATVTPKTQAQIDYEILVQPIMLSYQLCLTEKAAKYAKTDEPLNDVIDAAFGACFEERARLARLPAETGLLTSSAKTEETLQWLDSKERNRLKSFVIELRTPN